MYFKSVDGCDVSTSLLFCFLKREVREIYKVLLDDDEDFVGFDTK